MKSKYVSRLKKIAPHQKEKILWKKGKLFRKREIDNVISQIVEFQMKKKGIHIGSSSYI